MVGHFRTPQDVEVDFVLEARDGAVVGVEVKVSATVRSRDFKGLRMLAQLVGEPFRRGIVLYTGPEVVPFAPNLVAVPISMLWSPASPHGVDTT